MDTVKEYARYWLDGKTDQFTATLQLLSEDAVYAARLPKMPGLWSSIALKILEDLSRSDKEPLPYIQTETSTCIPTETLWIYRLVEAALVHSIPAYTLEPDSIVDLSREIGKLFTGYLDRLPLSTVSQPAAVNYPELERYGGIFHHTHDAVFITDASYRIVNWNAAAAKLWGYTAEAVTGKNFFFLFSDNCHRKLDNLLKGLQNDPSATSTRMRDISLRNHRKRSCPVDLSACTWLTSQGRCFGFIVQNITEYKKAEQELKRKARELESSNAELEQFAYVASHDLKEPLRMVSNYTMLLQKKYEDQLDDQAREYIGFAVDGVLRMSDLIQDLLNYSRLNTDKDQWTQVDLNLALTTVLHDFEQIIAAKHAQITSEALPTVYADPVQMEQLFQNLISNALKFNSGDPVIRIGSQRPDGYYLLHVRDNGIGLKPEYTGKIFNMFQRLHNRAEYPGTGIGLAICKKIIDRHGGRIWVESQEGKGSTFYFTLPAI